MLIVCPNCATSYLVEPPALGPVGRVVRCTRCKTTWFAEATSAVAAAEDAQFAPDAEPLAASMTDTVAANEPAIDSFAVAGDSGDTPPMIQPAALLEEQPEAPVPHREAVPPLRIDGPPVAIEDAPPLVPSVEQASPQERADAAAAADKEESFVARRERLHARRKRKRRSSRWTAVILVLFAFNVALIGARSEIVRFFPQTASLFAAIGLPVNLRHLVFERVRITRETVDNASILMVSGSILSTDSRPVEVPRLRFAVRNKAEQEIYTWSMLPSRNVLQPGERLDFTSRLASPPKDAHDVMVRFFTASDAMAGGK